jgi:hypothetical protein
MCALSFYDRVSYPGEWYHERGWLDEDDDSVMISYFSWEQVVLNSEERDS